MTGWGAKSATCSFRLTFFGHPLNEGDLQMQAHAPHGVEGTQPLHHIGTGLLHHIDVADDDHEHQNHQNGDPYDTGDRQIVGRHLFFLLFVL